MLSWLGKRLISRNMRRLREGDPGPTLQLDAEDIRFTFPGDSSWAAEIEGKGDLEAWLRRFVEVGLQIHPDEVILKGFPTRTRRRPWPSTNTSQELSRRPRRPADYSANERHQPDGGE